VLDGNRKWCSDKNPVGYAVLRQADMQHKAESLATTLFHLLTIDYNVMAIIFKVALKYLFIALLFFWRLFLYYRLRRSFQQGRSCSPTFTTYKTMGSLITVSTTAILECGLFQLYIPLNSLLRFQYK
jgi:hypothetical protein